MDKFEAIVSEKVNDSHNPGKPNDGEDNISILLCFSFQCTAALVIKIRNQIQSQPKITGHIYRAQNARKH